MVIGSFRNFFGLANKLARISPNIVPAEQVIIPLRRAPSLTHECNRYLDDFQNHNFARRAGRVRP